MVIIGLAVICLSLFVACAAGLIKRSSNGSYDSTDNSGLWAGTIIPGIVLIVIFVMVPVIYASNVERVGELKAFQQANVQNYAVAVDETRGILSELSGDMFIGKLVDGSLEKMEVGKSISGRIREWRDAVNAYNLEIAAKQKTFSLWVYPGWMVMPAEVNELHLLTIK